MIIRVAKMAVAGLVLTGLAACAHHGAAQISSIPSGAEVVDMDGDVLLGVTPVKVWWKENKEARKFVNVRIQKDGYRDKTTSFWVTLRHSTRDSAVENPQMVEISLDKAE